MRRIYWCFAAIGSMAIMGTVVACSSDDSSTSDGGTTTDGGGSDVVTVKDSGGTDSGTKDSGPCSTCGELLNGTGAISNACPGTLNKAFAVIGCACNNNPGTGGAGEGLCDVDSGTGDGGGACAAFCASPTTTLPDSTCQSCGADKCAPELGACLTDGQDGGTGGDGGDGG